MHYYKIDNKSTFYLNNAEQIGGAIYMDIGSLDLNGNTLFSNNIAIIK